MRRGCTLHKGNGRDPCGDGLFFIHRTKHTRKTGILNKMTEVYQYQFFSCDIIVL